VLEQLRDRDLTYVLRREGGRQVIVATTGDRLRVSATALRGTVEVTRSKGGFVFAGWAADRALRRQVDSVLVFVDGRQVYGSRASLIRPHRVFGQRVPKKRYGFLFDLPPSLLPAPGDAHDVRVFAVWHRVASELGYAGRYPWSHAGSSG
jgi:hypothetical protein